MVKRVVCKSVTVPQGFYDLVHKKLFFWTTSQQDHYRNGTKRCIFRSYKLQSIQFSAFYFEQNFVFFADGQSVQNIKPLKMNYTKHHYIRAYNTLFSRPGRLYYDEGLAIDRLDYLDGYALYAFDLSPDLTNDEKFELLCTGSVRLQLKFTEQLADPITLIVYAEYQNLIEIDHNRNVIYDFTA